MREANQQFSKVMKIVRGGQPVVLTERGRPVAMINPLPPSCKQETAIKRLEAEGVLRPAAKPVAMPAWQARPLKGIPLSRTVREERDSS